MVFDIIGVILIIALIVMIIVNRRSVMNILGSILIFLFALLILLMCIAFFDTANHNDGYEHLEIVNHYEIIEIEKDKYAVFNKNKLSVKYIDFSSNNIQYEQILEQTSNKFSIYALEDTYFEKPTLLICRRSYVAGKDSYIGHLIIYNDSTKNTYFLILPQDSIIFDQNVPTWLAIESETVGK